MTRRVDPVVGSVRNIDPQHDLKSPQQTGLAFNPSLDSDQTHQHIQLLRQLQADVRAAQRLLRLTRKRLQEAISHD
jgi:hypothetical protein